MKEIINVFVALIVEMVSFVLGGKVIDKHISSDKHPILYILLMAIQGTISFGLYTATWLGLEKIEETIEERIESK